MYHHHFHNRSRGCESLFHTWTEYVVSISPEVGSSVLQKGSSNYGQPMSLGLPLNVNKILSLPSHVV